MQCMVQFLLLPRTPNPPPPPPSGQPLVESQPFYSGVGNFSNVQIPTRPKAYGATRWNQTVWSTLPANQSNLNKWPDRNNAEIDTKFCVCVINNYWQLLVKHQKIFISLCYRRFRFLIGMIFSLLVYFQSISRIPGVGNCLFLHARGWGIEH